MYNIRTVLVVGLLAGITAITPSCTKTVEVQVIKHDTTVTTNVIQAQAIDTTFLMASTNWNAFNFVNSSLMTPGPTTYSTTAEGVKFVGQAYRNGARLQTKNEIRFTNKVIYYKWKVNGGGMFTDIAPLIKYDPLSLDGNPAVQGVKLDHFSVQTTFNGTVLVQNDTWYYTRVVPVAGTDNYTVKTATGNYDNNGGTVISTKTVPIYTKSGYIALSFADAYAGTNAYAILGECKVAAN
jgi:hypothetical protein